ncbi:hypothetical protein LTR56_027995 [Elasticomyces elasticus]|nr:hypothetical protein LTR56_027995 [Elasticomyces elasticus]KAK3618521.1 hypothetical protein LTR22_026345 [Elasticomyces elasticus]KAK4904597.1 hypothetical protein LTR49_025980 [Elasticomyces elasticus]
MDELSFQDSLGVLAQYSLINATAGGSGFSIHLVVHNWSLHNIAVREAREVLCARAIRMVAKKVPSSEDPDRLLVARWLLPHARMTASRHMRLLEMRDLEHELHVIAHFMQDWESSQEVESLYVRALRGYEEAWGPEHTSTLKTVHNLGYLYSNQGKMKEAEEMYQRALRGFEEAWGPKHTSTLQTVNNLGILYYGQGRMKEAEDMFMRSLRGKEGAWGSKHTSTLATIRNLGLFYHRQGKLATARTMYLRAAEGYERAEGDHEASISYLREHILSLRTDDDALVPATSLYRTVHR